MHFEIRRGYKTGRQISTAQRKSGTFAEEPVVLGKVLRRGMRPLSVSEEQFQLHKAKLLRLLLSGSVDITVVDGDKRMDYKTAAQTQLLEPQIPAVVGDGKPPLPLEMVATENEEQEAVAPPSSGPVEPDSVVSAPDEVVSDNPAESDSVIAQESEAP